LTVSQKFNGFILILFQLDGKSVKRQEAEKGERT
jgi:hypothetical protein